MYLGLLEQSRNFPIKEFVLLFQVLQGCPRDGIFVTSLLVAFVIYSSITENQN
jgi:hypothetical protein